MTNFPQILDIETLQPVIANFDDSEFPTISNWIDECELPEYQVAMNLSETMAAIPGTLRY